MIMHCSWRGLTILQDVSVDLRIRLQVEATNEVEAVQAELRLATSAAQMALGTKEK